MKIDNTHRSANWKDIAAEFQSERDALKGDVLRMQQERDIAVDQANKVLAGFHRLVDSPFDSVKELMDANDALASKLRLCEGLLRKVQNDGLNAPLDDLIDAYFDDGEKR